MIINCLIFTAISTVADFDLGSISQFKKIFITQLRIEQEKKERKKLKEKVSYLILQYISINS